MTAGEETGRAAVACEGVVVELLPSALVRVELDSRHRVVAHPDGSRRNYVRLVVGDRVLVELSRHDPTRGRIVRRCV